MRPLVVDPGLVLVLMMPVETVTMIVSQRFVHVFMVVAFRDMEPEAHEHEGAAGEHTPVSGSPRNTMDTSAPTYGAAEKYAPVRAAPSPRNAWTNSTTLIP